MESKSIVTFVLVGIIAAGIGFFAGTKYQASKTPQFGQLAARFNEQGRTGSTNTRTRTTGGGFISGQITSMDNQSLTIKEADGSSKIVILSGSTSYLQTSPATAQNVAVGDKVTVIGQTNADGSVTANTVSLGDTLFSARPNEPTNQQPGVSTPPAR